MIKVSLITSFINDCDNEKFDSLSKLMKSFHYEIINNELRSKKLELYKNIQDDNSLYLSMIDAESICYSNSEYIFICADDFDPSIMITLGRLHCLTPGRIITFSTKRNDTILRNERGMNCKEIKNPFIMSALYKHLDHYNEFIQFLVDFSIQLGLKSNQNPHCNDEMISLKTTSSLIS